MADHYASKSSSVISWPVASVRRSLRLVRPPAARSLVRPASQTVNHAQEKLHRGLAAVTGFALMARAPLECLAGSEAGTVAEIGAGGIHEMRVAARRLRTLLAAFADCLDEGAVVFLRRELSWLQHGLAPAREWDVFIAKTLGPRLASSPDERGLEWLAATARAKRSRAYVAAQAILDHRRYARLILRFRFWLDSLDRTEPVCRTPVETVLSSYLYRQHRKLLKGLKRGSLSDSGMHRLRLRMKKVADIAELAKPLYRGARRRRFMSRLSKLQSSLGKRQDAVVARQLAAGLGRSAPQSAQATVGAIAESERTRIACQASRFAAVCDRLLRVKTFWRKTA